MGTTQDISVRVEFEQALRESDKSLSLFRELIDRTNDAIEVVDPLTHRFLDVNQKMCSDLGYTRKEILQMCSSDIDPNVNSEIQAEVAEALKQTGSCIREGIHRRKDGSTFPVEVNINLIQLDRNYIVNIARDITERKQAEDEIRKERDRAQRYLDVADVILLALDLEGRITLINRKGCSILKWEERDLLGRNWMDTCLPARIRGPIRIRFQNLLNGDFSYIENPILTKWGVERLIGWHNTLLRDAEGRITGTLSSGEDITERKKAEDALSALSAKLINVQDEERRHIAMELHETLAQDLAALKLSLGHLKRLARKDNNPAARVIAESLKMGDDIIEKVRALSYTLHPPLLDDVGLPIAVASHVQTFSKHTGIEVNAQIDLPEDMCRLPRQYELTLFRIVQECLLNVFRHSHSPVANVWLLYKKERLILEVADRGQGIPSLPVGIATKVARGLGIATMRERVKQLCGMMDIDSKPGHGVTIRVVLPLPNDASKHTYEKRNLFDRNVSNLVGG
jgi:PAS domain S-box-containing protein